MISERGSRFEEIVKQCFNMFEESMSSMPMPKFEIPLFDEKNNFML